VSRIGIRLINFVMIKAEIEDKTDISRARYKLFGISFLFKSGVSHLIKRQKVL